MSATVAEIQDMVADSLHVFGLEGARLRFVKHRENTVFRADTGDGAYAVRVSRAGARSPAELNTESAYMVALRERGFPASEPVPPLTSGWSHPVSTAGGEQFRIAVQRWEEDALPLGSIESAFDGSSDLTSADFERLGVLTGRLHNELESIGRLPGYSRPAWDAAGLFGPLALWGNPLELHIVTEQERSLLTRAVDRLGRALDELGHGSQVYGVIHADLSPENFLVRGDHVVVIDFDDFGEGWHLYELATLLFFFQPHPDYRSHLAATIAGYRSQRDLTDDHLALWTGMLLARGLTFLGWASRHPDNDTTPFLTQEVFPWVLELATRFLAEGSEDTAP